MKTKLKFLIDEFEDKPNIKKLLLKVAEFEEDKQDDALKFISILLGNKKELEKGE